MGQLIFFLFICAGILYFLINSPCFTPKGGSSLISDEQILDQVRKMSPEMRERLKAQLTPQEKERLKRELTPQDKERLKKQLTPQETEQFKREFKEEYDQYKKEEQDTH